MQALMDDVAGEAANAAAPVVAEFVLRRNCSLAPGALMLVFGSVAALSFGFGAAFAALGAWMILPFAGIELLALGVAFVIHGRHATDCERVRVAGDVVRVEVVEGSRSRVHEFPTRWVRLLADESRRLRRLMLVGRGEAVEVGRHLDARRRAGLEQNLRAALREAARVV
jgi:uncharacterized membrane protein